MSEIITDIEGVHNIRVVAAIGGGGGSTTAKQKEDKLNHYLQLIKKKQRALSTKKHDLRTSINDDNTHLIDVYNDYNDHTKSTVMEELAGLNAVLDHLTNLEASGELSALNMKDIKKERARVNKEIGLIQGRLY